VHFVGLFFVFIIETARSKKQNATWCSHCVYVSQNKHQLLPYTVLTFWFCITEMDSV